MKANELRIGNIVHGDAILAAKSGIGAVEFTGQIFSISSVEPRIRINIDKLGLLYASDCMLSGVTLTEEILLKCGFKQDTFASPYIQYKKGYFEILHDINKNTFLIEGIKYINVYCKSLHELQNLYFALTGEELNVSEILK